MCSGSVVLGSPEDGVSVWWVLPTCAGCILQSTIGCGTSELWLAARHHPWQWPAIGRAKKEWGIFLLGVAAASLLVRWDCGIVGQCCDYTSQFTWSTICPSERACDCHNAGWNCTGCAFWRVYKNRKVVLFSPNTVRGLLGNFAYIAARPSSYPPV